MSRLRFWGASGELELTVSRTGRGAEDALSPERAAWELQALMGDAGLLTRAARLAYDAGLSTAVPAPDQVRSTLEGALRRGLLTLRKVERRRVVRLLETSDAQTLGPEETTTDWIGLSLVDGDGNPVPNARYSVTASDGSVYEGSLDAKGRARVDGIPPGNCVISFPEIDANEYSAA